MSRNLPRLTVAREAIVVFEDRADSLVLRCLRPGFRHCFCLLGENRRWTLCDPLKSQLAVAIVEDVSLAELRQLLEAPRRRLLYGTVLEGRGEGGSLCRLLTCVEIVKRLLGITAPHILTPHQLYRMLLHNQPCRPAFTEFLVYDEIP
jgi:hypothetical protein